MLPTLWAVAQLAYIAPRAALLPRTLLSALPAAGPHMRQGGLTLSRRASRRKRGALKDDQRKAREMLGVGQGEGGGAIADPRTDEAIAAVRGRIAPFRYLCVMDVEATCDRSNKGWVHEIIELPVVLVDLHTLSVVAEFQSFVRPTVDANLTDFCKELTGISQASVDAAPTLPEVLESLDAWITSQGLVYGPERRDFAFAADGPWDLMHFLDGECERKAIPKAEYFDKWVNIKDLYADFYKVKRCKIARMLELQGMRPEGRLHSGIDDTRNIARIAMQMGRDGCRMYLNEALPLKRRSSTVQAALTDTGFKPMDLSGFIRIQ
jgi:3'-5' exoribonuclease 1